MGTFEKCQRIIAESTENCIDAISPETTIDELGLDSIDLVDIVTDIEDAFSVSVPDEEFENIKTVGDIVALIDNM